MHKFKVKISVYESVCHIVIANDIEKVINRYAKKYKWDKDLHIADGEKLHGYTVNLEDLSDYYIFFNLTSLNVSTITHEVSHMVDNILGDRDVEDSEARAYLAGYINEKVFDYVIKKKLFVNKWLNHSTKNQEEKKIETPTENQSQPV